MSNKKKKFKNKFISKDKRAKVEGNTETSQELSSQEEQNGNMVPGTTKIQANSEKEAIDMYTQIRDNANKFAEELADKYKVSKVYTQFLEGKDPTKPIIVYIKPMTLPVFKLMSQYKDDPETAHEVLAQNLVLEESDEDWEKYDDSKLEVIKFLSMLGLKKNSSYITSYRKEN